MVDSRLEEIRKARLEKRQSLIDGGQVPYPSEVRRTHLVADVLHAFEDLNKDSAAIILLGRVLSVRRHGGVAFLDLRDTSGQIQLQLSRDEIDANIFAGLEQLDSGDWIQASGTLTVTQRGVQTLATSEFHIVSKAIRPLPDGWYGLKDHETRYRQREVDLVLNEKVRNVFEMRSRIVTWLRSYLVEDGYVEVETPVLQSIAGGAAARPFTTHHNALDMPLFMRISAELYLKRLLVGGFEKVFEIGKRFRNEGIDRQHNPEFTMLESQWAHADYEDLMDFTEDILEGLVRDVAGHTDITWQETVLSFAKPFERVRYVDLVNKRLGIHILEEKDPEVYKKIFEKEGLELPDAQNYYQLVDELYKELIRPNIIQPTLIYDYPAEMAPLAKRSQTDDRIAEVLQLVVHGMELSKCYTEMNDPVQQREEFEKQEENKKGGDKEAQSIDEEYLRAMEYGMPPNAGWSLGIDRFVMLMTDSPSIRDTILFPLLRPEKETLKKGN